MKKLSVLIALALVLTIGGAYATWTYANGAVTLPNQSENVGISMGTKDYSGSVGSVAVTTLPSFVVEPVADKSDYHTNLEGSGNLVLTFTPDDHASDDIKTGGSPVKVKITITENPEKKALIDEDNPYKDTTLLTLKDNATEIIIEVNSWSSLTHTISASTLLEHLDLASIELINEDAYDAYAQVLAKYQLTFEVIAP